MPTLLENPLYKEQYDLGRTLLGLYDPVAEEERRKKALGQMEDVIARRYARAGETGSSVEKDALQNAAKDFSLDWAERRPKQYAEAISGSQLPLQNFLAATGQEAQYGGTYGGAPTLAAKGQEANIALAKAAQEAQYGGIYGGKPTQAASEFAALQPIREAAVSGEFKGQPTVQKWQAQSELEATAGWRDYLKKQEQNKLWGNVLASLGLPQWLANTLFGIPYGATGAGGVVGQVAQGAGQGLVNTGLKSLYNSIFGNAGTVLAPYGALTPEALTMAQSLIAQGYSPQLANEVANAVAQEGLSPAGESISNSLANFSNASAPAAGTGAGTLAATAAPSVPTAVSVGSQVLGPAATTPGAPEAAGFVWDAASQSFIPTAASVAPEVLSTGGVPLSAIPTEALQGIEMGVLPETGVGGTLAGALQYAGPIGVGLSIAKGIYDTTQAGNVSAANRAESDAVSRATLAKYGNDASKMFDDLAYLLTSGQPGSTGDIIRAVHYAQGIAGQAAAGGGYGYAPLPGLGADADIQAEMDKRGAGELWRRFVLLSPTGLQNFYLHPETDERARTILGMRPAEQWGMPTLDANFLRSIGIDMGR